MSLSPIRVPGLPGQHSQLAFHQTSSVAFVYTKVLNYCTECLMTLSLLMSFERVSLDVQTNY